MLCADLRPPVQTASARQTHYSPSTTVRIQIRCLAQTSFKLLVFSRNDLELLTLPPSPLPGWVYRCAPPSSVYSLATEPGFLEHRTSILPTELYPSLSFKIFTSYSIQEGRYIFCLKWWEETIATHTQGNCNRPR